MKQKIEKFLQSHFPVTADNSDAVITFLEGCRNDWHLLQEDWNKRDVFAQVYLSLSEAYNLAGNHNMACDVLSVSVRTLDLA